MPHFPHNCVINLLICVCNAMPRGKSLNKAHALGWGRRKGFLEITGSLLLVIDCHVDPANVAECLSFFGPECIR